MAFEKSHGFSLCLCGESCSPLVEFAEHLARAGVGRRLTLGLVAAGDGLERGLGGLGARLRIEILVIRAARERAALLVARVEVVFHALVIVGEGFRSEERRVGKGVSV